MENLSLKELKRHLSDWVEKAHDGKIFTITRYNKPYAVLRKAEDSGLHIGSNFGKKAFKGPRPVLDKPIPFMKYLQEDREVD